MRRMRKRFTSEPLTLPDEDDNDQDRLMDHGTFELAQRCFASGDLAPLIDHLERLADRWAEAQASRTREDLA